MKTVEEILAEIERNLKHLDGLRLSYDLGLSKQGEGALKTYIEMKNFITGDKSRMNLDEMRRIAAARTKGDWDWETSTRLYASTNCYVMNLDDEQEFNKEDAEFIAMAANTFDVLLDIAERAIKEDPCTYEDLIGRLGEKL